MRVVGLAGYGVSLTLFVLALSSLAATRKGAYFSVAPFVGAVISMLLLGDRPTPAFFLAAGLMAVGVWFHLTEWRGHEHEHSHDQHHQHVHGPGDPPGEPHSHPHDDAPVRHTHPHYPDIHHRHDH